MENQKIIVKGKLEFCEADYKGYSGEFTAILQDSSAFRYGNGTGVTIIWGKTVEGFSPLPLYLDTRYDSTIKRNRADFVKWLKSFFAREYRKHVCTIYESNEDAEFVGFRNFGQYSVYAWKGGKYKWSVYIAATNCTIRTNTVKRLCESARDELRFSMTQGLDLSGTRRLFRNIREFCEDFEGAQ